MRKALATLGVLAVLLFGSAIMAGCEEKSDDSGDNGGSGDTPATETESGD